ncbi:MULTISPECIES: hypothetical protein [Pseudomonas]|uniref:hypothetical protein n=1 Tax=Pseudomonas TaxID=286 RepID=UPI00191428E1|nr:hypothetical protein [Pseudomonas sp. TH49]MBK5345396.1 hypothetical protein [Pseudomonas sp. TH49]
MIDSRTAPLQKQATFESPVFFCVAKSFCIKPDTFFGGGLKHRDFSVDTFPCAQLARSAKTARPVSEVTDFRIRQQRKEEANGSSKWNE